MVMMRGTTMRMMKTTMTDAGRIVEAVITALAYGTLVGSIGLSIWVIHRVRNETPQARAKKEGKDG